MKRLSLPLIAVAIAAPIAFSAGTAAATGLTTCTIAATHEVLYERAGTDTYAMSGFSVDASASLVLPAEFYVYVIDGVHETGWGPIDTRVAWAPTFSWSQLLDYATEGNSLSLTEPLEIAVLVGNTETLTTQVCSVELLLMPNAAPTPPSGASAVAGDGSAVISWTDDNGFEGKSYTVTSEPDGLTCTADYPDTSCEIDGLENGTEYTFIVTATSSGGTSDETDPTDAITPVSDGSDPSIPETGTNSTTLILAALLALATGSALLGSSRRRRTA